MLLHLLSRIGSFVDYPNYLQCAYSTYFNDDLIGSGSSTTGSNGDVLYQSKI